MVDKKEILELFKKYFKTTDEITIDDKGLVSCTGDVGLQPELKHERLPVSFDMVDGDFWCHNNQLTTLEGAPTSVGGDFGCYHNQLTTLEGAPTSVGGDFRCYHNQLTSLEGMPAVEGTLWLSYSPTLPLLRCLLAKEIQLYPKDGKHKTAEEILNRYAGQGKRALFDCQKDLEDAGFEGNAKW
jgi:hypothetical protein